MNNKGFMMAEVVVVSSIILVALIGLYTSYNKVFAIVNQRVNYYDVVTLYKLANIRDNGGYNFTSEPTSISTPLYTDVANGIEVFYIDKYDVKNINTSNKTFKEYGEFLYGYLDFDSLKVTTVTGEVFVDNILVMERCISADNCKYAYLEVAS